MLLNILFYCMSIGHIIFSNQVCVKTNPQHKDYFLEINFRCNGSIIIISNGYHDYYNNKWIHLLSYMH
jgi:hypothetical protein